MPQPQFLSSRCCCLHGSRIVTPPDTKRRAYASAALCRTSKIENTLGRGTSDLLSDMSTSPGVCLLPAGRCSRACRRRSAISYPLRPSENNRIRRVRAAAIMRRDGLEPRVASHTHCGMQDSQCGELEVRRQIPGPRDTPPTPGAPSRTAWPCSGLATTERWPPCRTRPRRGRSVCGAPLGPWKMLMNL